MSLQTQGWLDKPAAPMLLVNGEKDTQQPISDLYLMMKHGDPKDAWVNPEGGHMGRSEKWPQRRVLDEVAEDLAFAISHAVHLFHPEVAVLGGGLSLIGEPLRAAVEKSLAGFVMEAFAPGPRLCIAGLGEDAVPVGASRPQRSRIASRTSRAERSPSGPSPTTSTR